MNTATAARPDLPALPEVPLPLRGRDVAAVPRDRHRARPVLMTLGAIAAASPVVAVIGIETRKVTRHMSFARLDDVGLIATVGLGVAVVAVVLAVVCLVLLLRRGDVAPPADLADFPEQLDAALGVIEPDPAPAAAPAAAAAPPARVADERTAARLDAAVVAAFAEHTQADREWVEGWAAAAAAPQPPPTLQPQPAAVYLPPWQPPRGTPRPWPGLGAAMRSDMHTPDPAAAAPAAVEQPARIGRHFPDSPDIMATSALPTVQPLPPIREWDVVAPAAPHTRAAAPAPTDYSAEQWFGGAR